MARKEAELTACMIVQQLDKEFFTGWTDEELKAIEDADPIAISNVLNSKLHANNMQIEEIHIIIHDQDVREVWDNIANNYVIEQKPPHFHALIRFWKDETGKLWGGTIDKIANSVGLETQYIEKPRKGKYAYDNMLAYLIHIKDADKHQYDVSEVKSMGLMDTNKNKPLFKTYEQYYSERRKDWLEGRAKKKREKANIDIDMLEELILTGQVVKNQILLTDEYFDIYARNKRRCDDAFDTYAQKKIARTIQAMENGEFKVSVFFITGASHSGKSVFTDNLVKQIQKDIKAEMGVDWSVCSVASNNPFDEYLGEEILVMDDLRGMSLTPSDWLKLLDPDRINTGSARYRNKKMACRVIVINSEKDVLEFFYYLKGNGGGDAKAEALDQFFRRILARVKVYRVPNDMDVRRIEVGQMQETNRYLAEIPGTHNYRGERERVSLHHDFNKDLQDMDYTDAQEYISAMVVDRNKKADNNNGNN